MLGLDSGDRLSSRVAALEAFERAGLVEVQIVLVVAMEE